MNDDLDSSANYTLPADPVGYMDGWEATLEALIPLEPKLVSRHFDLNLTGDNGFMSINKQVMQLRPVAKEYKANKYPL